MPVYKLSLLSDSDVFMLIPTNINKDDFAHNFENYIEAKIVNKIDNDYDDIYSIIIEPYNKLVNWLNSLYVSQLENRLEHFNNLPTQGPKRSQFSQELSNKYNHDIKHHVQVAQKAINNHLGKAFGLPDNEYFDFYMSFYQNYKWRKVTTLIKNIINYVNVDDTNRLKNHFIEASLNDDTLRYCLPEFLKSNPKYSDIKLINLDTVASYCLSTKYDETENKRHVNIGYDVEY